MQKHPLLMDNQNERPTVEQLAAMKDLGVSLEYLIQAKLTAAANKYFTDKIKKETQNETLRSIRKSPIG